MKHLIEAHDSLKSKCKMLGDSNIANWIEIDGNKLSIKIQDGPIGEVGINGIQVTDSLEYLLEVYKSLQAAFPCRENSLTITKIEEAIHWQEARTRDRERRKVEGYNKA